MNTNTTETTMHGHGGPQGAPATDIDSKALIMKNGSLGPLKSRLRHSVNLKAS